jgi:hypothetical protein
MRFASARKGFGTDFITGAPSGSGRRVRRPCARGLVLFFFQSSTDKCMRALESQQTVREGRSRKSGHAGRRSSAKSCFKRSRCLNCSRPHGRRQPRPATCHFRWGTSRARLPRSLFWEKKNSRKPDRAFVTAPALLNHLCDGMRYRVLRRSIPWQKERKHSSRMLL